MPISSGVYNCPCWFQIWAELNMGSIPKVCASSGTMGTMYLPVSGFRISWVMISTTAAVVEKVLPAAASLP
jgi:hypothetical protein